MLFILYVCICFRCSFAFVAAMSIYVVCVFFFSFSSVLRFFSYSFCHFERIIRKHNGWNKAIYMCLCEDFKWNATAMSWKMFSRIWYTYTIMHYSSSATKAKQDSFFLFSFVGFFYKIYKTSTYNIHNNSQMFEFLKCCVCAKQSSSWSYYQRCLLPFLLYVLISCFVLIFFFACS